MTDEVSTEIVKSKKKKNSGEHSDNVVPIAVGNPAKASALALDQSCLEEFFADTAAESSVVRCERPPKGVFLTVLPEPEPIWENRAFYWVLQLEGRDPYIVDNEIKKQKADEEDTIRPVLFVRYVTMAGDEGLWPLKLDRTDGKSNDWNISARRIMELAATGKWVRIVSMKKHYRHQLSTKTMEEVPPKFSDRPFKTLIDMAFEGRVIDSLDHEIWTVLKDGSTK
jgi:hypothetical protein